MTPIGCELPAWTRQSVLAAPWLTIAVQGDCGSGAGTPGSGQGLFNYIRCREPASRLSVAFTAASWARKSHCRPTLNHTEDRR